MSTINWNKLSEEKKYHIWSIYYETVGEGIALNYSEWCDLMDGVFL